LPSEKVEDRFQGNSRHAGPVKDIGKNLQEARGASAVDERISAIEIVERPLKAIGPGLAKGTFRKASGARVCWLSERG
jgi:hypothetical protein